MFLMEAVAITCPEPQNGTLSCKITSFYGDRSTFDYFLLILFLLELSPMKTKIVVFSIISLRCIITLFKAFVTKPYSAPFSKSFYPKSNQDSHNRRNSVISIGINVNLNTDYLHILDLDLSINNGIISSKIYDKRDDFDFAIVNYPHLNGDVPRATSYGAYK